MPKQKTKNIDHCKGSFGSALLVGLGRLYKVYMYIRLWVLIPLAFLKARAFPIVLPFQPKLSILMNKCESHQSIARMLD